MIRLTKTESAHLPDSRNYGLASEPEEAVAERFAEFGRQGLLEVPNPRLAVDHFVALTLLLALNNLSQPPGAGEAHRQTNSPLDQTILEGVRAFLRAYAPTPG